MTRTSREGTLLDPYYRNPIYAQGETLSILARYWAVEDLTSLYIKLFIQKNSYETFYFNNNNNLTWNVF